MTVTGKYQIDPVHSRIGFVARHAMVTKVRGNFTSYEADLYLDADQPSESRARVVIQADSVHTGNDQRDGHLRTGDFLEVERFPEITFVSTSVERVDEENFRLTGDLTIKSVTRPVTLDLVFNGTAVDVTGAQRAGFEGKTVINRSDYGVTFNAVLETGGVMVSEKITLEFDISAIKE